MTKKQYKCIILQEDIYDKISELARLSNCPKTQIINKLVTPIFEVACLYQSDLKIQSYPMITRSDCYFLMTGSNPRLSFGKLTQPFEKVN